MVTLADFTEEANLDADDPAAARAFGSAQAMLDGKLVHAYRSVPDPVYDGMVLEVATVLYKRRNNPSGSESSVGYAEGRPVMGPRDPLVTVMPILRQYVLPF